MNNNNNIPVVANLLATFRGGAAVCTNARIVLLSGSTTFRISASL